MARNGMRWDPSSGVNNIMEMEDDLEDLENNSAKLFERSRIKALAGKQLNSSQFLY